MALLFSATITSSIELETANLNNIFRATRSYRQTNSFFSRVLQIFRQHNAHCQRHILNTVCHTGSIGRKLQLLSPTFCVSFTSWNLVPGSLSYPEKNFSTQCDSNFLWTTWFFVSMSKAGISIYLQLPTVEANAMGSLWHRQPDSTSTRNHVQTFHVSSSSQMKICFFGEAAVDWHFFLPPNKFEELLLVTSWKKTTGLSCLMRLVITILCPSLLFLFPISWGIIPRS